MPYFGRRVIGQKAFDQQKAAEVGGRSYFGHRVVGKNGPKPPPPEEKKVVAEGISVDELARALQTNSSLFESLYEQELARPSGARIEALDVLLQFAPPEDQDDIIRLKETVAARRSSPDAAPTPPAPAKKKSAAKGKGK